MAQEVSLSDTDVCPAELWPVEPHLSGFPQTNLKLPEINWALEFQSKDNEANNNKGNEEIQ